jgi:5-(carboxyamino)imidazole ribonucleotide synthase
LTPPILPGATLGILGGGQLGRMTAMAARTLGYDVEVLDPDPSCAARFVVDQCHTAAFDDAGAASVLAKGCDVVTLEIEKISLASLEAAARHAPVRPGATVLAVIQDRGRQKSWLEGHGFPVGPWRLARTAAELGTAIGALGGRCFVKAVSGGYDGRSQVETSDDSGAAAAWAALGEGPCAVEKGLDLAAEISVLVARRPSGPLAVYPPSLNHHEKRILDWAVMPGPIPRAVAHRAEALAAEIATALGVEGLLAVEYFLLKDGSLVVNELAPRPHNTFHTTEVACVTSQFEQLVRAVCDLPLGSVEVTRPGAIVNLLGDLWVDGRTPAFDAALALPGVRLHLYGKRGARPGRKMGHLSAVAATADEAVALVKRAKELLVR